jgi:transcriptional regulator with XRE-family HTH domain
LFHLRLPVESIAMINAQEEVDRMLSMLRNKIRDRGFTQLQVQSDLKWGRSYISQLLTKQKSLRVEQVLQILDVIGIDPSEFFAELFKWSEEGGLAKGGSYVNDPVAELEIRRKLDSLQTTLEGLVRLLVDKQLLVPSESASIFSGEAANRGRLAAIWDGSLGEDQDREGEKKPRRRRKVAAAG